MDEKAIEPPGIGSGLTYAERVDEFIRMIAGGATVRAAAAACSLDWSSLYRQRRSDPALAKRWEDAQRITIKQLEDEAFRRAMNGSDKLLQFLLERRAPELYGARERVELTNPDGSLQPADMTDEQRAARIAAIMAIAQARKAAKAAQGAIDDLI